jgi:hypothetical protein
MSQTVETPPPKGRTLGIVLAGAGGVALIVGTWAGLRTFSKVSESERLCSDGASCANPDAVAANDDARTHGWVSTIAFAAGIGLVAAGAYFFLTPEKSSVRIAPTAGGVIVRGSF